MEKAFNDTPDYILARIAVEAMEMFTRASAHRDDFHEFRTADYARKQSRGFAVYIHEITNVWQCAGQAVNLPRG